MRRGSRSWIYRAERHGDEIVQARWTVDPASLRDFTREVRLRYRHPPENLIEQCERYSATGIEVVFRDDAFFVGDWCWDFLYNEIPEVRVHETWLQMVDTAEDYEFPVPLARGAAFAAERIAARYDRMRQEAGRRAFEERHAPTLNNRLLDLVEGHFVWVVLGLFFAVIPLLVLLAGMFRGSLS